MSTSYKKIKTADFFKDGIKWLLLKNVDFIMIALQYVLIANLVTHIYLKFLSPLSKMVNLDGVIFFERLIFKEIVVQSFKMHYSAFRIFFCMFGLVKKYLEFQKNHRVFLLKFIFLTVLSFFEN